jgi:Flp pilus assembly protein TadD
VNLFVSAKFEQYKREITAAPSLNSADPEVQNMRAVIEAKLGDFRIARNECSD